MARKWDDEAKGIKSRGEVVLLSIGRLLLHKKLVLEGGNGGGGSGLSLDNPAGLGLGGHPLEVHLDACLSFDEELGAEHAAF